MRKIFDKIYQFFKKMFNRAAERNKRGLEWVGTDGFLNMESSALLTIFLMIFFSPLASMAFSFVIVLLKCLIDDKRGSKDEKHDFICCAIGVIAGVILGASTMSILLF